MVGNRPESDFRRILRFYREAGCRGFGEYIPNVPFDHPVQMNLFRQVEEVGLPLTFHIAPDPVGYYGCYDDLGLPRLEKVLKACPALKFFGHSQPFWAEIGADVTEETRSGYPKGRVKPGRIVDLMRRYPNLYGDLSAGSGFNAISRDPEFGYGFMEEFQDRLMFGTDICWPGQETPIVEYFQKLRQEKLISPQAWEKIAWRNADRLLGLGLAG
jgi:predicted TIM-barrel fold metal-dependent hydrolase